MMQDSDFGVGDSIVSADEQRQLLTVVREALEARVTGRRAPDVICVGPLALNCGAFVSIHSGEDLRGCLGRLSTDLPLGRTLVHLGGAVADSDPRFPPVTPAELPLLHVEISLLTPERPIASIEEIEPGRHGLIVEHGYAHGLLLPQVATDHQWDRATFLEHACIKAGLPRDAWKTGAHIHIFEAHVFGG